VNSYLLASAAALAVAAVILLALFSLPKPAVAPQCSDCDFVIKGPVTAYVNFSYPRNYTKAYLFWGNTLARSSTIGEYAWSYPLLITCNDYMFARVRGGILYATCGSGSVSIIRNWYSGPFDTGGGGDNGKSFRYLKVWVYVYVTGFIPYLHVRVYVNNSVYNFVSTVSGFFNLANITLWYDLQTGKFLTANPSGTCVNATIKSVNIYTNLLSSNGYISYLAYVGPSPTTIYGVRYNDDVEFWGDGYNAEYGVKISLDGAPDVVVTFVDTFPKDFHNADVYWIQLCS